MSIPHKGIEGSNPSVSAIYLHNLLINNKNMKRAFYRPSFRPTFHIGIGRNLPDDATVDGRGPRKRSHPYVGRSCSLRRLTFCSLLQSAQILCVLALARTAQSAGGLGSRLGSNAWAPMPQYGPRIEDFTKRRCDYAPDQNNLEAER